MVANAAEPRAAYEQRPWLHAYPEGVPGEVEVPRRSIGEAFDEACTRFARRPALIFYGRRITYARLHDDVQRFAAALHRLGVSHGDRVGLYLLNSPQFVVAYFAVLKLGAAVTAISPVYTSHEIRTQLRDSGARVLVCQDVLYDKVAKAGVELEHVVLTGVGEYLPAWKRRLGKSVLGKVFGDLHVPEAAVSAPGALGFRDLLRGHAPEPPAVEVDPERDLAALPYTGGTTGSPKGVMLTHRSLLATSVEARAFWPIFEEGQESLIAFLPFFHIYGQVVIMLNGLLMGQTLVLFTTPDVEEILHAVERYRATAFYGVPTLYDALRDHKATDRVDWRRLKLILCGADTLHEATVRGWEQRTGAPITEGYGLTETSGASHGNPLGRSRLGSFGVPVPNHLAGVVDPEGEAFLPPGEVGELVIAGPNVMQGYWQRPQETREAFLEAGGRRWLRTGDLVRMDDEGYFHYVDRAKDLIKVRGYSVFAKDVEAALREHPQVKGAGVIGVPDPGAGHVVKAIVVLQPEARGKVTEEEIQGYCRERLAHYKVPRIVEFRGELPRTDVGKVSRRELREDSGPAAPQGSP